MKYLISLFVFILLVFQVDAQTIQKPSNIKDTVKQVTLDTLKVVVKGGERIYRATTTKYWDITNTRIALAFNYSQKTASAREWIKMHPHFYVSDSVILDAKSMQIDSLVLICKKQNINLQFEYINNQLIVHFDKKYQNKDSLELYIKYTAMPYGEPTGGSNSISDDRGLYFINSDNKIPNKPIQIWTQGESESNSHWMVTIDKPNYRFTTQIELTVADSFTTLSNGLLINQIKEKNGLRTDIWKMDMPIQPYVAMFAIGKFSIVKDHWKSKEVNYYVENEYASLAKEIFKYTPEMMDYFSARTGVPFPWNKYSQVVVRDYVSGAMENTTAALFGEFMYQNKREIEDNNHEMVVAHELFHEWFGDYVTAESWSNLTLNESFANYGEHLWKGYKYGKAARDEYAYNDLMGYLRVSKFHDPSLVRYYYDNREEMFDAISYNKGGCILKYINTIVGDTAFDMAMKIYLTKNALHPAEAQNWRMALEEVTGQDWNWFFNEWYFHGGHPILNIDYYYNDTEQQLQVTVTQKQQDSTFVYQLPLKAALIIGKEKNIIDFNVMHKKEVFNFDYKNGLRPMVIPDYYFALPGKLIDNKEPKNWLSQYINGDEYVQKILSINGAIESLQDTNSQKLIDIALNDSLYSLRQYVVLQLADVQNTIYRNRWKSTIELLANKDKNRFVKQNAFNLLGIWKDSAALQSMITALDDSSYLISGAALGGINKINADTAYYFAKKLINTNPKSALELQIWSIIGEKANQEDLEFYIQKEPFLYGKSSLSFAYSLYDFLKNTKGRMPFLDGIDIMKKLIIKEEVKTVKKALVNLLFDLAENEKEEMKDIDNSKAAISKNKFTITKEILGDIISTETETELKSKYLKRIKEL